MQKSRRLSRINPYDHHIDVYHSPNTGLKANSLSTDTEYSEHFAIRTYKEQLENNGVTMIVALRIRLKIIILVK